MEIGAPTSPTSGGHLANAVLPHAFLTPQKPRAAAHAGSSRLSGSAHPLLPVETPITQRSPSARVVSLAQDESVSRRSNDGVLSYSGPEVATGDDQCTTSDSARYEKTATNAFENQSTKRSTFLLDQHEPVSGPSHLRHQSIESSGPSSGSEIRSSYRPAGGSTGGSINDPLLSLRTRLTNDFGSSAALQPRAKSRPGIDPDWAHGPKTQQPPTPAADRTSPSDLAGRQRRYKEFSKYSLQDTKFFCSGRLLTGGDNIFPFLASIVLLLGLGGLWLGTTGIWIWRDGLGGGGAGAGGKAAVIIFGYLLGVCFGAMMATALRDPGILPRNLDPVPQTGYTASTNSLVPLSRELQVRKGQVSVKYCETCRVYRAPRSSHCRLCGNCVEGIDHHCTYLHNCIGRRNYSSFVAFLVSATICLVYSVVFAAMHYVLLCHREGHTFVQALGVSPESGVNFVLGIILVAPILALLGYHIRLMLINSTTVERIRYNTAQTINPADAPSNPFAYHSHLRNFAYMLCRPQMPSWIDANGWREPDRRLPNPGSKRTV